MSTHLMSSPQTSENAKVPLTSLLLEFPSHSLGWKWMNCCVTISLLNNSKIVYITTLELRNLPSVAQLTVAVVIERGERSSSITSSAIIRYSGGSMQFSAAWYVTNKTGRKKRRFSFFFLSLRGSAAWIIGDTIHLLGYPWLKLCFTWGGELHTSCSERTYMDWWYPIRMLCTD